MKVELGKMDLGHGSIGLLVYSMAGLGSLTFTPDDEGVIGISTRISPEAKKKIEDFASIGNVSQAIITRICIESGLEVISGLLLELKKAQEDSDANQADLWEKECSFDRQAYDAEVFATLSEFRKKSAARKAGRK